MLSKVHRFSGHKDVRVTLKYGNSTKSGPFQLKQKQGRSKESRVAVIVSKKISKSAVKRNRMRRRIYEIIRKNWSQIKPSYSIVITIYSDTVLTMEHQQLEQEVLQLLQKAKLLRQA